MKVFARNCVYVDYYLNTETGCWANVFPCTPAETKNIKHQCRDDGDRREIVLLK